MPQLHCRDRRAGASSRLLAGVAAGLVLFGAAPAVAHEVPATATVQMFVKPDGQTLQLLVRAPLASMRDVTFPLFGAGYLDIDRAEPALREAALLWIAGSIELFENGRALGAEQVIRVRPALPSDRSFGSYDTALQQLNGPPLDAGTQMPWEHALLDVLLEVPIASDQSDFSVRATFAHLGLTTTTLIRFLPPVGGERFFQYTGDRGTLQLEPRWHQVALQFVRLGFLHILDGIDHLLFILCLVIPFRRLRPLVEIVTAFTVAHSITLVASVFGLAPTSLWFPPLVETLIAASILYMAVENIIGARLQRRWLFAFGFGLVHGFGFAFALQESLQFAGAHLAASLFAFNVGVELGQLVVLLIAVPVLALLFRYAVAERMGVILLSAFITHTAWHWTSARFGELRQYSFAWPTPDAALLAGAARWLMLLLIAGFAAWLIADVLRRYRITPRTQVQRSGSEL